VAEVRAGLGFLAAVEIDAAVLEAEPGFMYRWQRACREGGVRVRPLGRGVAVSPPLICTGEEIDFLATQMAEGLERASAAVHVA
jgi:adenosylmethionine-8-amino-7-oxononanoate aminotransferase